MVIQDKEISIDRKANLWHICIFEKQIILTPVRVLFMKAKSKKKLCWNCEGSVSLQVENCPYCGVYVSPENEGKDNLFAPPYSSQLETKQDIPVPPYALNNTTAEETTSLQDDDLQESEDEKTSDEVVDQIKDFIQPMILLLAGTVFFIFGLTLLLFSHEGVFTLKWNGNYWFLYLLISLPMLGFGWITLQKIKDIDN